MKKKILVLSLSLCILLVGCTTEDTVEESQENTVQDSSVPVGGGDNEVLERSETLSDIIVETYGIDDATTIILNDTAIIGVRISYDQELTDEIVEIRFDLKFEFDEVDEDIFTEWYHNDIEQGKEMLNEYLGIENYTEVSI